MKLFKFAIFIPSILSLFGCVENIQEESIKNSVLPEEHDYKEIQKYYLSVEGIFDVENDQYYAYFYSLTCSHCQELKDFIIEKGLERHDIYFIQSSANDQFTTDPNLVINAENPGDIYILGYPTMLKIEDKKVTKNLVGNEEIIKELK